MSFCSRVSCPKTDLNTKEIQYKYEHIKEILKSDKRTKEINHQTLSYIDKAKAFDIKSKTSEVVNYLKNNLWK